MAEKGAEQKELIEKIIRVSRVAKVVKGGRRFSFSALIVVGDGKGKSGYGLGKANEVTEAIRKGVHNAQRNMQSVAVAGTTIPHEIIGKFGAGKVFLKPAKKGHGIISAGAVRAIMESVGIDDISVKCQGSRNPHNLVRATYDALFSLRSFAEIASNRGKAIEEIDLR